MSRLHQSILIASTVLGSWLGMQAVHESGHVLGASLGTEFLPQLDEGVIWIRANLPAGISLEKSAAVARDIRLLIRESPEVNLVASQTGRNDAGTDPFGPNRNEFLVDLRPYDRWPSGRTKPQLVAEIGFAEWTRAGKLRQPRYQGLRDDKSAREVVRETPS